MAKAVTNPELFKYRPSVFTLTFAIEVLGIDVWHDCNEGWLDLGSCDEGIKIQYNLYPGQTYDLDILIWPHIAKVWRGTESGWVRTWQFLQRRWLTFSIRHVFPVRVAELLNFVATVSPVLGVSALSANAKNDKNANVYLPTLKFGERRYFAPIIESEEILEVFIANLIWSCINEHIPPSCFDGVFDIPQPVTDVRHQDAVLINVRNVILNTDLVNKEEVQVEEMSTKERPKDKKKVNGAAKQKFEIKLSGDAILSGAGRVIPFNTVGDRPQELGEIIVLISSHNLPAEDDVPILFVNIENLNDIPVKEFEKQRITHLYTRWILGEETHDSEPVPLTSKQTINFNDHHTLLLHPPSASEIIASFFDNAFEIQLRAKRLPKAVTYTGRIFFGYGKGDRDFNKAAPPKPIIEDTDVLLAITKIDARDISKGNNIFIKGEYSLYPPQVTVKSLDRDHVCSNDINGIRAPILPVLIVPPSVILEALMTLETSIGMVGYHIQCLPNSISRLFALINDGETTMKLLDRITDLNNKSAELGSKDMLLTGYALDTGDVVLLFVEGPKDGQILHVWEMTADFHFTVKPVFSTLARYSSRIYSELLTSVNPFLILKMYAPLSALLACPAVYARPALPLPTRSAVMKLGRLIAGKLQSAPSRSELPSTAELASLRLELCTPMRPIAKSEWANTDHENALRRPEHSTTAHASSFKVNWEAKKPDLH